MVESRASLDQQSDTLPQLPSAGTCQQTLRSSHYDQDSRCLPQTPESETTKMDFTQRLQRKLAEYNASNNIFKRWLFEMSSWLVAAVSMGAIVGIYIWLKGRPLSQASELLTFTNILGKVASAALIVPTSEALGQLKWNWFHSSKAMWDFEIFDKASRGPMGAVLLLFRTKGRSLAALGAILIVLLLAIDTFFQQVVTLPDRWALQDTMSVIPRVVEYNPLYLIEYWQTLEMNQYDKGLRPIVQEFLYNNGTQPIPFGNGTRPDIPLSCPTSNCTWPMYETLAVCSSCVEMSGSLNLTYTCLNMSIEWTNTWPGPLKKEPYPDGTVCGHFLNATSESPTLLSGYTLPNNATNHIIDEALLVRALPLTTFLTRKRLYNTGSIHYSSIRNPIMDFLIASASNGLDSVYRGERPVVHECVLNWCVQSMRSSYEYGTYHEEVLDTFQNATGAGPSPWFTYQIPENEGGGNYTEYLENVTIVPPTSRLLDTTTKSVNLEYGVNNITANNVMAIFDDFFPSYYTAINKSAVPRLRYKEYFDGPYGRTLPFNPWSAPNNISKHVARLAVAMTNSIRSSTSADMLAGDAYQKEVYVQIRWQWLTFPLVLLLLSLVFLASTIYKTSDDGATGVWKTSAMPTLIYSLPKEMQGQFNSSSTWASGKGTHRTTRIKLLPNMGWRVSGQSYLIRSPQLPSGDPVPHGWI